MPDLLLELFSEEIPARMQRQAAEDLRRLVTNALVDAGLTYEGAVAFATPRRLALSVHELTARSADVTEEKKGPRVGAPEKAIEGFLKSAGLASIGEAKVQSDKKGDFYVASVRKPGRAAEAIIAEAVPAIIRGFPWPKSMRWGERSSPQFGNGSYGSGGYGLGDYGTASLRWVRPLRSILCTFGPETEEPLVVNFEVGGITVGDVTFGHRFMAGGEPIKVRRFDDYVPKLEAAKVVLDPERRKAIIETEAKNLAFAQGLEVVADEGLLEETAGLVEWPVVLMGRFDEAFLKIPPEVVRLTIRQNQKCFVLRRPGAAVPPTSHATGEGDHAKHGGGGEPRARLSPPPPTSSVPLPRFAGEEPGEAATKHSPHPEVRPRTGSGGASKDGGSSSELTNRFLLVANIEAKDGGKEIVAGNERVIAARLSDARFFYEQDLKVPLEEHAKKLASITFHEKLGTQAERVERIARLAVEIADVLAGPPNFFFGKKLDADDLSKEQDYRKKVRRAAELCKADLTTGMVGEFPELQGAMGRYYAQAQGEDAAVADAIRDHYKPQGPNDVVSTDPISVAVALADKLDTLVGFWAIDEKPTGSKDPYALRRAALGVIRILLESSLRFSTATLVGRVHQIFLDRAQEKMALAFKSETGSYRTWPASLMTKEPAKEDAFWWINKKALSANSWEERFDDVALGDIFDESLFARYHEVEKIAPDLVSFFADRLKVHLRDTGARHDLIDAVFALPGQDDLLMIVRRVEALGKFLDSEDGKNLLVGYRRAANILRAEEKKDGEGAFHSSPDHHLIEQKGQPEERALFNVMQAAEGHARKHVEAEDFEGAMRALAELRPAVDAFFDKVTVNADDPALRTNRLRLLNMLRRATLAVADFSKIGGG